MPSLLETNPYLRDPEKRRQMLEENAYQSSVFEGAQGLTPPAQSAKPAKRRSIAARKKSVSASNRSK
jgi:hypothetical protein